LKFESIILFSLFMVRVFGIGAWICRARLFFWVWIGVGCMCVFYIR